MTKWCDEVPFDIDISPVDTECDISGTIHSKNSEALASNDFRQKRLTAKYL